MMALSGVRSSWLMVARKRDLAALAVSALRCASSSSIARRCARSTVFSSNAVMVPMIAILLHDREAAGDRLGIAIGDQLLRPFDRCRAVDHRAAVIDVEPQRLGELAIEPLAL